MTTLKGKQFKVNWLCLRSKRDPLNAFNVHILTMIFNFFSYVCVPTKTAATEMLGAPLAACPGFFSIFSNILEVSCCPCPIRVILLPVSRQSHVTGMNEQWHTYEWDMWLICISWWISHPPCHMSHSYVLHDPVILATWLWWDAAIDSDETRASLTLTRTRGSCPCLIRVNCRVSSESCYEYDWVV